MTKGSKRRGRARFFEGPALRRRARPEDHRDKGEAGDSPLKKCLNPTSLLRLVKTSSCM